MPATGPPTILFEVFWTQQKRKLLLGAALEGTGLPPDDYPLYVLIGAEGPLTPTALGERLEMPLSTVLFRLRGLERRGHAERIENPHDGRSFLMRLTPAGKKLLDAARPRFRAYAEAVEARLGSDRVAGLRDELVALRSAIAAEVDARRPADASVPHAPPP